MRVAIVGGGMTGLAAGLELARQGVEVLVCEKKNYLGGLAAGYKPKGWGWSVERFYHHIFSNDSEVIDYAQDLGLEPIFSRPNTSVFWRGQPYRFDSPMDLIRFPGLDLMAKLRMGAILLGFKILPNGRFLERWTAKQGLKLLMGKAGYETIWEPLMLGKFGGAADKVSLTWFWARIKKRTPSLGTFEGGFQALIDKMSEEIVKLGSKVQVGKRVNVVDLEKHFDVVLSTVAEPNGGVKYLDAHVLWLELTGPLTDGLYWLNILDREAPFLVVVNQTEFVDKSHYGGNYLAYIGSYLPAGHRLYSLSADEVMNEYIPWIKKIDKSFSVKKVINKRIFKARMAQPVMEINYSKNILPMKRKRGYYVANQAMIYPWDRGVNYAVKLGREAAKFILVNEKF